MKDHASQSFLEGLVQFKNKEDRELYEVEEAKAHIIADLHRLEGIIGREAAKKFVQSEWLDLAF